MPPLEKGWLEVIRHSLVHYWAAPVALDVSGKPLRVTLIYSGDFMTGHRPVRKSMKMLPEVCGLFSIDEVNEGVSQTEACLEVDGQVDEIVLTSK